LKTLEVGLGANWFSYNVICKVFNGWGTSFWKDKWIGEQSLALLFPRIFSILTHKEVKVRDLGSMVDGGVFWNLTWRSD
jgi:hypothetical protein